MSGVTISHSPAWQLEVYGAFLAGDRRLAVSFCLSDLHTVSPVETRWISVLIVIVVGFAETDITISRFACPSSALLVVNFSTKSSLAVYLKRCGVLAGGSRVRTVPRRRSRATGKVDLEAALAHVVPSVYAVYRSSGEGVTDLQRRIEANIKLEHPACTNGSYQPRVQGHGSSVFRS